jgi:hypothetical protein
MGGVEVQLQAFLISVSFTPRPLCPWESVPRNQWMGRWVGLRASLNGEKFFFAPIGNQILIYWLIPLQPSHYIYGSRVLLLDLDRFFSFLILYTVGRTPWTGDQPVARPLPPHRQTQTQNKRTQTSILRVGFEPTIPAFERAKTVHALSQGFLG